MGSASVKMLWVCCWVVFDPWQFPVNDKQLFGSQRSTNNRSGYLVCRVVATTHSQFERNQHYFRVASVWRGKISTLFQSGSTMEGYSNSYQNGTSARETEFQRLAQNVGTNVQKILQNGIAPLFNHKRRLLMKKTICSFFDAADDQPDWDSTGQPAASEPTTPDPALHRPGL